MATYAIVTFEGLPPTNWGGIPQVVRHVACELDKHGEALIVTPYHGELIDADNNERVLTSFPVRYGDDNVTINVLQSQRYAADKIPVKNYYFIQASDPRFFSGKPNPYVKDAQQLLRDSLLFGSAVAEFLKLEYEQAHVLMQDWEAATTALFLAGDTRFPCFLTLHNSYDSPATTDELLRDTFGIDPTSHGGRTADATSPTVLERIVPVIFRPVSTVSERFAYELTHDPLQTQVMASHLQTTLLAGCIGIDNPCFTQRDQTVPWTGDAARFFEFKAEQRAAAATALRKVIADFQAQPRADEAVWGEPDRFEWTNTPWFVMTGRDDPGQRGHDAFAEAITEFLEHRGSAQFIYFTLPGNNGLQGIDYLEKLARKFPRRVLVLVFRASAGFNEARRGAGFGVMPSYYEPFGGINEFYLLGTLGLVRATGGLTQQVRKKTGLIYREAARKTDVADLVSLNETLGAASGKKMLDQRTKIRLFRRMVKALAAQLGDAVKLWRNQARYLRMTVAGADLVESTFTSARTAAELRTWVASAQRPGTAQTQTQNT